MKHHHIVRIAVVTAVLALGAGAASAQKELKLGTVARPGMPIGDAIEGALIPKVAEVSGGELVITPHYRGSICGEQICGEQANQGLLQLWTSSTANFGNFSTALSIFDLPYLFASLENADKITNDWLGDAQCAKAAEDSGHVCFEVFAAGGFRQLGNAKRPVHKPDDLKGIKMRVTKSPIEYTLIKTWGAVPVPYDWTQLYQGLQTGVVEGQYVQTPWQHLYKMYEVQKYYTEVGGAWGGNHISMDKRQFEQLSADEQKWLRTAVNEFGDMVRELDRQWVVDGVAAIKKEVDEWYQPSDAEMALWREGAVGAWVEAKGTYDPKLAERALAEQGLDEFIATLKKAGAL